MNKFKFEQLDRRLVLIITTTIFSCLSIKNAIAHDHVTVLFQPPPEDERPEETEGAASRNLGECATNSLLSQSDIEDNRQSTASLSSNLTALVPRDNYGLTTSERPNFWVYLPETSAKKAILSIKEKDKSPHWQQSVDLLGTAGITGIKLSDAAPALEIGKRYQWALILVCGDRPSPNDPVVAAWIERAELAKFNNIDSTTEGLEKASAYARQGIWYDALDVLIAERSSMVNWNSVWRKYLQSGGLDRVANKPIIEDLLPAK